MKDRLARRHYELGNQLMLQGREADARDAYQRACDVGASLPEPYFALAQFEVRAARCEQALVLLNAAISRGAAGEALEWRAFVNGRLYRYEAALADYHAVIGDGRGDAQVWLNVGRTLLALRRYEEAEAVLAVNESPAAIALNAALPRYREFTGPDRLDDGRAIPYLFGRTIVLGTQGDGGLDVGCTRYLMLTPRHVVTTVARFMRIAERQGWRFDGVAGQGAHHGPVARLLSDLLGVPRITTPTADARILLCAGVLRGTDEARRLRRPWIDAGAKVMLLALGHVPEADPSLDDPELVGLFSRAAVRWYRVEPYARLMPDDAAAPNAETPEGCWAGFKVGPAFVNPNEARVTEDLLEAWRTRTDDPFLEDTVDYYAERHRQARAFSWGDAS